MFICIGNKYWFKRISSNIPNVSYDDLKYVQKRFISKTNLRGAIIKIINGNLNIRDKELFGDITISLAADSKDTSMGSKFNYRMACKVSWTWCDGILACR